MMAGEEQFDDSVLGALLSVRQCDLIVVHSVQ